MAEFTPNYGLHQWEPTDKFLRTDFNQDFEKIDTAIKGVENKLQTQVSAKAEIVLGTYTGNGASSQNIHLGFRPKAVLIENQLGQRTYNAGIHGGLATADVPLKNNDIMAMEIYDSGFRVFYTQYYSNTNASGTVFFYLAFK